MPTRPQRPKPYHTKLLFRTFDDKDHKPIKLKLNKSRKPKYSNYLDFDDDMV
jgi:hypothetical protein